MSAHNHQTTAPCDHKLEHCRQCDVVVCNKCGQEWGGMKAQLENFPREKWPAWPLRNDIALCVNTSTHNHQTNG